MIARPPFRTNHDIDTRVDVTVEDLLARRLVPERTERLKTLGAAAVPRLLHHLATGERLRKTIAFYALQYCWSRDAIAAVGPYLSDEDEELRRMAAIVLVKGSGYDTLVALCLPLIENGSAAVRAFALDHVESERPSLERMRRLLWRPESAAVLVRHLPRYHAVDLVPALIHRLELAVPEEAPWLLAALIHTNADAAEVRARVVAALDLPEPATRAMASEYLCWHGGASETSALEAASHRESDPLIAAAHSTAAWLVRDREPRPTAVWPASPLAAEARRAAYEREAHRLVDRDGRIQPADAEAWALYRYGEPMEPHWAYRGTEPPPGFAAERLARLALQARLFAIPGAAVPAGDCREARTPPPADRFGPPHRGYSLGTASNFGLTIAETAIEGFTGLVHIGDDTAWHQPHTSVHAIAAGMVRAIACTATWGVVVVIEHREPWGRQFCSIYGHLSPFVTVRLGGRVEVEQKLGSVGRAYTWENGGYAAHLHFGIHDGPYLQAPRPGRIIDVRYHGKSTRATVIHADTDTTVARLHAHGGQERVHKQTGWLAGYVSEAWFTAGDHGWIDPRAFLLEKGVNRA